MKLERKLVIVTGTEVSIGDATGKLFDQEGHRK